MQVCVRYFGSKLLHFRLSFISLRWDSSLAVVDVSVFWEFENVLLNFGRCSLWRSGSFVDCNAFFITLELRSNFMGGHMLGESGLLRVSPRSLGVQRVLRGVLTRIMEFVVLIVSDVTCEQQPSHLFTWSLHWAWIVRSAIIARICTVTYA